MLILIIFYLLSGNKHIIAKTKEQIPATISGLKRMFNDFRLND